MREATSRTRRPAYLRPALIGLVMLGGTVGTTLRAGVAQAFPTASGGWPWATFGVNILGAFLLGALSEGLAALAPQDPRRRALQLALGTGLLGGFTTYSSFAVETLTLITHGSAYLALGYAALSVATGFGAAFVGMSLGRRLALRWRGESR